MNSLPGNPYSSKELGYMPLLEEHLEARASLVIAHELRTANLLEFTKQTSENLEFDTVADLYDTITRRLGLK